MKCDIHRVIRTCNLHLVALLIQQFHLGTQTFARSAAPLGINDNKRGKPGNVVDLLGDRRPLFDIFKLDHTSVFRNDRPGMRVPRAQNMPCLNRHSVVNRKRCTIGNLVPFTLATVIVSDQNLTRTRNCDSLPLGAGDIAHLRRELDRAI